MRGATDLSKIGGKNSVGSTYQSYSLQSWKKNYFDVRIVDCDASGLHEKVSENLLDLL